MPFSSKSWDLTEARRASSCSSLTISRGGRSSAPWPNFGCCSGGNHALMRAFLSFFLPLEAKNLFCTAPKGPDGRKPSSSPCRNERLREKRDNETENLCARAAEESRKRDAVPAGCAVPRRPRRQSPAHFWPRKLTVSDMAGKCLLAAELNLPPAFFIATRSILSGAPEEEFRKH